jgi:acyl-coenzyme A synthetase/AMP-(fatty) acid ligase
MLDFQEIFRRFGDRTLFLSGNDRTSYRQFAQMLDACGMEGQGTDSPDILDLQWTPQSFARLLGSVRAGRSVFLGNAAPAGDLQPFVSHSPLLVLRTGGTTGEPRHVVHSAQRLLERYKCEERPALKILVLYAAGHIAGLDAFFQAFHRGATLVIPNGRDPHSVCHSIEHFQVEVLPATPTFLQFLLLSGSLDGRKLSSVGAIPHGAEPMPPALRQRLHVVFPHARLLHRFGLTELGALPVRPDPADPDALFLDQTGYAWEIREGELWIKSPARMLGTLEDGPVDAGDSWHPTGDLAEETPRGSIRVLGRREAMINVGGEKVLPETVEALVLEQPGISDAAVEGCPNPLTGQAVCARVIFSGEPAPAGLMRQLRVAAREQGLSLAHVPTRIIAVDQIGKTETGKRDRSQGKA